jgi:Zinc finger C-x8-C-x5-C-x3-H type (and similar)
LRSYCCTVVPGTASTAARSRLQVGLHSAGRAPPLTLCLPHQEGSCARGENCPYAHNVFEYWLHPTRYRTQLCNDGTGCKRRVCFFAHSLEELRVPSCKPFVPPEQLAQVCPIPLPGRGES